MHGPVLTSDLQKLNPLLAEGFPNKPILDVERKSRQIFLKQFNYSNKIGLHE